jgi:fatty acid desaturase
LSLAFSQVKEQTPSLAIPTTLNLILAAFHILLNVFQLFLLPLYLLPLSPWWGLTLVPAAMLNNPFWSLIHEAIHDMLIPSSRVNQVLGRLLSVLFGSPFRVLRLSHLLHHKLNRSPLEGTELYDPNKTSWIRASAGYYFQILGGLYLLEVISPVPFFLPRRLLGRLNGRFFSRPTLSGMLMKGLLRDEAIQEMRRDGIAIVALFALSVVCYGEYWPLWVAALVARAFLISFLDNVYHYGTPVNDTFYADNLRLPDSMSVALLHFNLHGIHHRNPAIPWTGLPDMFQKDKKNYDGAYLTSAFRQLYGPVPLSELMRRRT